jgi:hypothetical protein
MPKSRSAAEAFTAEIAEHAEKKAGTRSHMAYHTPYYGQFSPGDQFLFASITTFLCDLCALGGRTHH